MISDSEIAKCPEYEVESKIGNIFVNEKILEEYSVKFMKSILIFMSITKKVQVDENWCKHILFRIDVYFTEYILAVEIDEKGHTDRDLISEEKRQKALDKKLGCKLLELIQVKKAMIQTMKLVEYKHLLANLKTGNSKN